MPELSEVETTRRILQRFLRVDQSSEDGEAGKGGLIADLQVFDDDIVVQGFSKGQVLVWKGARASAVSRWGKQFWIEALLVDGSVSHLLMHLGMTGSIRTQKAQTDHTNELQVRLQSKIKYGPEEWPPKFCKMILKREDGCEVAFCDPRRLGRIRCTGPIHPRDGINGHLKDLGFDPIHNMPDQDTFSSLLSMKRKSRAPLKALLLDQSFSAGVGNWLADEICFQAQISPKQRLDHLILYHADAVERVRKAIEYVCSFACSVNADSTLFPANWLFHDRWEKKVGVREEGRYLGRRVVFERVGGRTTAIVPAQQHILLPLREDNDGNAGSGKVSDHDHNQVKEGSRKGKPETQRKRKRS